MPSGTGKTVSLLSVIIAYQQAYATKDSRKLIYCSRTVPEIEKALAELKRLMAYRQKMGKKDNIFGLGLSSRKNLCVHQSVKNEKDSVTADSKCRNMTAPWIREKKDAQKCTFFENIEDLFKTNSDASIPFGVYTLEDFKDYAQKKGLCPYFLTRRILPFCNVIIYSYHYLLDPKVAEQVSRELSKDSIVIFDEAHNIDNVCTESLSIDITRPNLDKSTNCIQLLTNRIEDLKKSNSEKLQNEYKSLVQGLQNQNNSRLNDELLVNPGNIILIQFCQTTCCTKQCLEISDVLNILLRF
jgi:DNA excision repair protein ERCC-2